MLKERIKYVDHDGKEYERDFYFHLSKADLIKLEVGHNGGLETYLGNIINSQDNAEIMQNFETIFKIAYGIKLPDDSFVKRPEETEKFFASEAWSEFLVKLISDADYAAKVINNLVPKEISEQAAKDGFRPGANTAPPPAAHGLTVQEQFETRREARLAEQQATSLEDTQPTDYEP